MSGGFDRDRLARLDRVLTGYVERGEVPGLVALLSRGGETHVVALGSLALGDPLRVRRDAMFRVASMSKPVTAAAAMLLVEECVLRLDEPVDRLLPELAGRRVVRRLDGPLDDTLPAERAITVRDLLTFCLGFGIVMAPPGTYPIQQATDALDLGQGMPRPQTPPAPDEWLRRFATLPLLHQPGEQWMYNTGSDLLGVLIGRAAGMPFESFLAERLFAPLGMRDTAFFAPAGKLDRFAASYWIDPRSGRLELYDPAAGGEWSRPPAFASGGGGLVSTADDFLAFGRMLLDGGKVEGRRVLSRAAVDLMTSDQLTPAQKAASNFVSGFFDRTGWGFGMAVMTGRNDFAFSPGSFGWDGGLGTSFYVDPREGLIGVLLTQRAWTSPNPPPVRRDFWTLAYQAFDD